MTTPFFEGPLLSWLATYAVHSTLILGATWLLFTRTSFGSLPLREAIWKTALLGGLVTATLQSAWQIDPLAGRWILATPPGATSAHGDAASHDVAFGPATASDAPHETRPLPIDGLTTFTEVDAPVPQTTSGLNATSGTNGTGATSFASISDTTDLAFAGSAPGLPWGRWTVLAWLVLGSLCLMAMAASWRHLGRSLAGRRRVREGSLPGLLAMLRRRGGVRRHVRLYTCPGLASPIAMGTLFPQICLPQRVDGLPSDMQESILAHELAHLARFDPFWLIVARTLEMVFFFQPLNRMARRHIQHDAELLCDDWAVERTDRPIVLARSLAEVAGWLVGERAQLACGMVAQGSARGSALGARVSRLLNSRQREPRSAWRLPAGTCLLGATILLAPGFADHERSSDRAGEELDALERDRDQPLASDPTAVPFGGPALQDSVSLSADEALGQLAQELSSEFDAVARSLAELRSRIASDEVPASVTTRLESLEQRASALLEQKERMNELMTLWQSTRSTGRVGLENTEVSR